MKKRLLSLFLAFAMVFSMLPATVLAGNGGDAGTVYISVSHDGQYVEGANGKPVAYIPVSLSALQAIDLADYGLADYVYGDQLTALYLYIYAHENIMVLDWDNVRVSGGMGSIFFEGGLFGFTDCNLQYYYNGAYPQVNGWGVTADQLVLKDGDFLDIAAYTSWAFYGDSATGFHYFLDDAEITHEYTAAAGEPLTVTLGRTSGGSMGEETSLVEEAGYAVSYGAVLGTADGTVTTESDGTAEITFAEAGTYYLWVNGGYGNENTFDIVSSPAYAVVTVEAGEEEPADQYVPDENDVVIYEGNTWPSADGYISEIGVKDAEGIVGYATSETYGANIVAVTVLLDATKYEDNTTFSTYYLTGGANPPEVEAWGEDENGEDIRTLDITMSNSTAEWWNNMNTMYYMIGSKYVGATFVPAVYTLDKAELNLEAGNSEKVTASLTYYSGTHEWSSSDENVATVAADGTVTAVANGTATITAKVGNFTATCEVTVSGGAEPETSVTLSKTELRLSSLGDSAELTATVVPDGTAEWATTDAEVADIFVCDGVCYVQAMAPGECDVTATANGVTATCDVTVYDPVVEFPFTVTVDGTALEPVADGTEVGAYQFRVPRFVLTVPAGAKTMHLQNAIRVIPDGDMDKELEINDSICAVDLTQGYEYLFLFGNNNDFYQLHIEFSPCEHSWNDATCTIPKTCSVCGKTEGEANPDAHKYVDGVCEYCEKAESTPEALFVANSGTAVYEVVFQDETEDCFGDVAQIYSITVPADVQTLTITCSKSASNGYTTTGEYAEGGSEYLSGTNEVVVDMSKGYEHICFNLIVGPLQYECYHIYLNVDQGTSPEPDAPKAEDNVTIVAPAGSTISVGRFYSYFKYDFSEPLATATLEDGSLSYIYAPPGDESFVRVQHPNGVTYWDFGGLSAGSTVEVTEAMLFIGSEEFTKETVYANYEKNSHDTADLYMTANAQGWLDMDSGDTHSLNVFRNWIPVANSISNNGVSLPDVEYKVVSIDGTPSDVVEVIPDANNSCYADIKAVKAGTAIILVSYDAVYNADGEGGKQFSAIWPENTGVIVVTVDADDASIQTNITVNEEANAGGKQVLDVEHDILFYVGDKGAEYSFKPEDGCTVTVARSTVGNTMTFNGFTADGVAVAEDGTVTLSGLTTGAHIVKVEKGGKTAYQVIRAREVSYKLTHSDGTEVTAANPAQPGESITVQFTGLIAPQGKLSGVYNANFGFYYNGEDGAEIRTSGGGIGEYYFGSKQEKQRFTVTVPAAWNNETYTLADGGIKLGGYGASFGAHRSTTYMEGKEVNTNASGTAGVASVLPDVVIPVYVVTDCEHEWKNATCEQPKTCTLCGETMGEADSTAHNYVSGKCEYCGEAEPEPTTYTVTLPTGTGYTVTATEGSTSPVTEGGSFSFTVTIAEGYEAGEAFAVKANGTALTAVDGVYTISNITADQTVTVKGVVEKQEEPTLTWQEVMAKTQAYLMAQVENKAPVVGSTNGEWVVLGLARNDVSADSSFFNAYFETAKQYIAENIDANGRLHTSKSTDNSRLIIALTALGKDATNVGGHDLLKGLSDSAYVPNQGINGAVFALIALDTADYDIPANADSSKQVTRDWLVDYILSKQLTGGGWALSGQTPDDMTPMAIQALAPYYNTNEAVKTAVDKALAVMTTMTKTPETYAQIIVALSALGIDCETDERFANDLDNMLTFALEDGSFEKAAGSGSNQMSTEQCFYALVAYSRFKNGQTSLYDMSDLAAMNRVEILPCENGTVTVDKSSAVAGDTVTVTVAPDLGYQISKLTVNDAELTVTDNRATFTMPDGMAILEATFVKAEASAQAVAQAMTELAVDEADEETYDAIGDIKKAYSKLTAAEKLEIADEYRAFQNKVKQFESYLKEHIDDAVDELEAFYDDLDEDDYSKKAWKKIEDLYEEAVEAVKAARFEEEVYELLDEYLEELEEAAGGELEVTFRLIGDWKHDDGVSGHDEYVTWIETTEYSMPAGSTIYDLFIRAMDDFDLNQKGASKNYVETIQAPDILGGYWLGEFDNGQNSGWMYTVNGDHPGLGLKEQDLEDGDEVIWHYVDDYTLEERKPSSKYYERWLEADDISPETYVKRHLDKIVTIEGEGEVKPELKMSHIGKDVKFTFTPAEGWIIKSVYVDGKDKGAIETYTYKDLAMDARIEVVFARNVAFQMNFVDVPESQWFYDDVYFAVSNGLFNGIDEDTFAPNASMTRAMLVTVLYRLEGQPAVYGGSAFSDVATGQWYTDAVIWATRNGIVNGLGNGNFGTNDNVTREQMAAILYRYAQNCGYDTTARADLSGYTDADKISAYAQEAMSWANAMGLVNGRTATSLAPTGTATRAEVAAIFHRFVENIAK